MTRMELQKWRLTIERILASAKNLEKQAERYRQRTTETGEYCALRAAMATFDGEMWSCLDQGL